MSLQLLVCLSSQKRRLWPMAVALGLLAPTLAAGLAGCSQPGELVPGAVVGARGPSPWQVQLNLPPPDYSRRLTDGEGEFVVAGAIAAHERRRP